MLIKIFNILLLIAAAGIFLVLSFGNQPGTTEPASSCSELLTFRIGEIDDRFHISEDELADILTDLSQMWSEAAGTPIMEYSADGEISVNLIYDSEQQITDQERQFRDRLHNEQQIISRMEDEYKSRKEQFEKRASAYRNDSEELELKIDRLNDWVSQINSEGGFNEETLKTFEERKEEIDVKTNDLDYRGEQLTVAAAELNRFLDELNAKIADKNKMIEDYNRTFSGVRQFTQGTYEWQGNQRWINVFQFATHRELELVIAHEMGHAIGIDHVSNPESVMHHLMGNQLGSAPELSNEDREALHEVCNTLP